MWDKLGEAIGRTIAGLVRIVDAVWTGIGDAVGSFLAGIARGLGVENAGLFTWIAVGAGLLLIAGAVRGLLGRSLVGPLISLVLGTALIGWAIS